MGSLSYIVCATSEGCAVLYTGSPEPSLFAKMINALCTCTGPFVIFFFHHRNTGIGRFQGGASVVIPYCYLFLLSVFILWFSYYVSDIFCKF